MNAAELLRELHDRGIEVTATPTTIKIKAKPGAMTDEVHQQLRDHKHDVIFELLAPPLSRVIEIVRPATDGTFINPSDLAEFLLACRDIQWIDLEIARWWVRQHQMHGRFPEPEVVR